MRFIELFNQETWIPDWDKIFSIKEFKDMESCQQSKVWHREGNVRQHSILVANAMQKFLEKRENVFPSCSQYYIMMMSAAICHDLGKPSTTKFDVKKNDYACECHGQAGAVITRRLFFDEEFELREKVCYMVRNHMTLHHLLDSPDKAERKLILMSHGWVTVKDMLYLNIADSIGSLNEIENGGFIQEKEDKIKKMALDIDCYDKPKFDVGGYEKIAYYRDLKQPKDEINYPSHSFTMFVVIGVPGSGKSTYIERYLKGVKHISRDLIRTEIGIKGIKPQGNKKQEDRVTEIFNKRVIWCCENHQDFVIDNTNVRRIYRNDYLDMVLPYKPEIVYVYVEAPTLNHYYERRKGLMPLEVIDKMWNYFDFPEPIEFNKLVYYRSDEDICSEKKNFWSKLMFWK